MPQQLPNHALNTLWLTLSWRRPLSYRNQSINLLCKSMDWFLYDNGLRHEGVKRSEVKKFPTAIMLIKGLPFSSLGSCQLDQVPRTKTKTFNQAYFAVSSSLVNIKIEEIPERKVRTPDLVTKRNRFQTNWLL